MTKMTLLLAAALLMSASAGHAEPLPGRGESSRCWQWLPDDEYHLYVCPRTPAAQSFVRGNDKETAIQQEAILRKAWSYQPSVYVYRSYRR